MKKSILFKLPSTFIFLLFLMLASHGYSQGKNEIAVRTKDGKPVAGVSVHVYDSKAGKCACFMGGCIASPFDQDLSDKHGIATFKGGKNRPDLKPNTDYVASIDDKCTAPQQRQCSNAQQDCSFSATWYMFSTDKNGKFEGFVITK